MGRKSYAYLAIAIVAVFFIAGCETVPKKFREEVSGIRSKVDTLESRVEGVESKQSEAERMASEQAQRLEEMKAAKEQSVKTNFEVKPKAGKSKEHMKEIQTSLQNAGFYKGKIDGMKGKGTKKAIKEFQKANGLKADGRVGPKTWELLSKYASGGAASSAVNPVAEGADTK